jgi:dTDP-4-dehydrorhamnose reductase
VGRFSHPMNILLFGADGQLGWQLRRSLCVVGEVTALTRSSDTHCGDITDDAGIARTVRELRPDIIVNAAAFTAVDRAESEPDAAFAVNHRACEVLATEADRIGAWLVHYSTEYVFDGSGTAPWRESDSAAPLNVYGHSKLAGEQAIARACPRHLILRTSWLFDTWGDNFLKWVLDAASRRAELDIVDDQYGAPTRAAMVADVTAHLLRGLRPELAGTYHVAAAGEASRHGLAVFALQCAQRHGLGLLAGPASVRPVPSSAFPRPAARPSNSRLDTHRLRDAFGLALPHWRHGVEAVVAELAAAAGRA